MTLRLSWRWRVMLSVVPLAMGTTCYAGVALDANHLQIRVRVEITAPDNTAPQLKSCINAGLRKIPEVIVVDDNSADNNLQVHIVVDKTESLDHHPTGFATSLV